MLFQSSVMYFDDYIGAIWWCNVGKRSVKAADPGCITCDSWPITPVRTNIHIQAQTCYTHIYCYYYSNKHFFCVRWLLLPVLEPHPLRPLWRLYSPPCPWFHCTSWYMKNKKKQLQLLQKMFVGFALLL